MRWCVVGAGAIGGVFGAKLHQAGEDVALVARGAHLHAIQQRGLTLVDGDGTHLLDIRAESDPAKLDLRDGDVVVLAVKSQQTAAALDALVRSAPSGVRIICAQNGIDNERQALRTFAHVYAMSVTLLASHLEPGVVIAHSAPIVGTLQIGGYPRTVDPDPFLPEMAAAVEKASFSITSRADVMPYKHAKLLVNLTTAIEALCGPQARSGRLAELVLAEGERCLHTAGLELPSDGTAQPGGPGSEVVVPRAGGSTWQSLHRATDSIETDYLNGEIVLLGRLHSIPTPANEVVQRAMRELAGRGGRPGTVAEADQLSAL